MVADAIDPRNQRAAARGAQRDGAYPVPVPTRPRAPWLTGVRRAGTLAGSALSASGCLPQAATAQGSDVAWLYNVFLVAAAAVFAVVAGLMAWSIIRYRGP